jgi:hypothetical protein
VPNTLPAIFEQLYATISSASATAGSSAATPTAGISAATKRSSNCARDGTHALPLLTGEFDFLQAHGWERQLEAGRYVLLGAAIRDDVKQHDRSTRAAMAALRSWAYPLLNQ